MDWWMDRWVTHRSLPTGTLTPSGEKFWSHPVNRELFSQCSSPPTPKDPAAWVPYMGLCLHHTSWALDQAAQCTIDTGCTCILNTGLTCTILLTRDQACTRNPGHGTTPVLCTLDMGWHLCHCACTTHPQHGIALAGQVLDTGPHMHLHPQHGTMPVSHVLGTGSCLLHVPSMRDCTCTVDPLHGTTPAPWTQDCALHCAPWTWDSACTMYPGHETQLYLHC